MGYRSNLIIAVKKEIIARDLITQEIPAIIKQLDSTSNEFATYYFINDWKWYSTYDEVETIEEWFASMNDEDYGAIRMGEDDDDIHRWGSPYDFDIYVSRSLECPVSQD